MIDAYSAYMHSVDEHNCTVVGCVRDTHCAGVTNTDFFPSFCVRDAHALASNVPIIDSVGLTNAKNMVLVLHPNSAYGGAVAAGSAAGVVGVSGLDEGEADVSVAVAATVGFGTES